MKRKARKNESSEKVAAHKDETENCIKVLEGRCATLLWAKINIATKLHVQAHEPLRAFSSHSTTHPELFHFRLVSVIDEMLPQRWKELAVCRCSSFWSFLAFRVLWQSTQPHGQSFDLFTNSLSYEATLVLLVSPQWRLWLCCCLPSTVIFSSYL